MEQSFEGEVRAAFAAVGWPAELERDQGIEAEHFTINDTHFIARDGVACDVSMCTYGRHRHGVDAGGGFYDTIPLGRQLRLYDALQQVMTIMVGDALSAHYEARAEADADRGYDKNVEESLYIGDELRAGW